MLEIFQTHTFFLATFSSHSVVNALSSSDSPVTCQQTTQLTRQTLEHPAKI